ncbi:MAG TPA: diguanylate cyclase [Terriglobales bacterium]|nr:diguanylate cyclase [Terriglobales bacterium]
MDRTEISKRIERAEKLLQKGKTADALGEYLQVLAADPHNDIVRTTAADVCLSLQRIPDAVRLLGELFEHQIQSGDATLASLTYKKLARFADPSWQQKIRFGQLLENSNRKLALETYNNALAEVSKHGSQVERLAVLRKIAALDPNEPNLLQLGELSSEAGDSKGAAAAFLRLGRLVDSAGANPRQWFERAYSQDPSDAQIALACGTCLLAAGEVQTAVTVLEPHVKTQPSPPELQDTYAKALVAANRLSEAEPLLWQMFESNPSRLPEIAKLIGLFVDASQDAQAVALARKLEQIQRRRGERQAFVALMQDLTATHRPSAPLLEYLGELFNTSNRESDYSQTLLKLFDLYVEKGDHARAADCLDRAAEVDAYESGHERRLEQLRGKINEQKYNAIASRFSGMSQWTPTTTHHDEPTLGASALQDLILQAEILVQYGMKAKALERVQRIQELFPHEEERNEDLQRLYLSVGISPRRAEPPRPAPTTPKPAPPPAAAPPAQHPDVDHFARVAEITQKLYRQTNADAVLSAAAGEIGQQWNVSRCVAVQRKPGLAATAVKKYCAEGIEPGDEKTLERVVAAVQELAISRGHLSIADVSSAPELLSVREALVALRVSSLLALPLSEGPHHMGVLLLMHNRPRLWSPGDVTLLKTLSDQIVLALHNAGLRRLVKNLSVTDERSGLMRRASYLDMLLGETRRSLQQNTPVTVVLLQMGKRGSLEKTAGEVAVENLMEEVGQICMANIRQNDVAFRYEPTAVALVLGETNEEVALMTVDKLTRLLAQIPAPGRDEAVPFYAGIAEAVVRQGFDAVDIVTEVINRVEQALENAMAEGPGKVVCLAAALVNAAVA